ncbi:MAG: GNAT family N-acetyltransferase [Dyella sp.]|uniref:GNAT family N-acetyltransferase n=1 Tax=Dyella sp. TaxID=1869338 RepID=UPI003F8232BB
MSVLIRPVRNDDFDRWLPLWDGYNAFYGRHGASALDPAITRVTWQRFLDPAEPMFAGVADVDGALCGLVHFLYHRSTTRIEPVCYLQDLFTAETARGQGMARALVEHVYAHAGAAGVRRVYWQTQAGNAAARVLYDRLAAHAGFIVYAHDV